MKKILVVVTNVSKYPELNRATGLWLGEGVHFAHEMKQAGYEIDYVSPKGGHTQLDPHSLQPDQMTDLDWAYYTNDDFLNQLSTTLAAESIDPSEYEVIYYAGGHGVMWDFAEDQNLQNIASAIYENGGHLINNKKVTGFANIEEATVGLEKVVPFLTEDELIRKGANYVKSDDWAEFAVADNRVVIGQNPASGAAVAKEVIQLLQA